MEQVYPSYYPEFRCIAGACSHSCCVGWEIDIDAETMALYEGMDDELGRRLRGAIAREQQPHFVLGEGERCPFLNGENLCDIILEKGEGALCEICREHPRFYNWYPERMEVGLGLCCEAAGALILGRREPVSLCICGERTEEDELLTLRDSVLAVLEETGRPLGEKGERLLWLCGAAMPRGSLEQWAERMLTLERLEEGWTRRLEAVAGGISVQMLERFDRHMAERESEYRQLMSYLVYRHLGNARDEADLAARGAFVVLAAELLRAMGALELQGTERFSFSDQVQLARQFSAEIEYSEENMETLLELLARPWPEGAWRAGPRRERE